MRIVNRFGVEYKLGLIGIDGVLDVRAAAVMFETKASGAPMISVAAYLEKNASVFNGIEYIDFSNLAPGWLDKETLEQIPAHIENMHIAVNEDFFCLNPRAGYFSENAEDGSENEWVEDIVLPLDLSAAASIHTLGIIHPENMVVHQNFERFLKELTRLSAEMPGLKSLRFLSKIPGYSRSKSYVKPTELQINAAQQQILESLEGKVEVCQFFRAGNALSQGDSLVASYQVNSANGFSSGLRMFGCKPRNVDSSESVKILTR